MRLELGSPVHCTDGPFGEVADVVVDPTKRRLTHLVVQPHNIDQGSSRLVPIELVSAQEGPSPAVSLRCTVEEACRLEPVREFAYLRLGEAPKEDPGWDIGIESVLAGAVLRLRPRLRLRSGTDRARPPRLARRTTASPRERSRSGGQARSLQPMANTLATSTGSSPTARTPSPTSFSNEAICGASGK